MTPTPTPFADLIKRQLELWAEQRAQLQEKIDEIDKKLIGAAKALGIEVPEGRAVGLDPLPLRRMVDARKEGTMAQFIRDFLANADRGYTRAELKKAVREADPKFADILNRNENSFYNTVLRFINKEGSVKDIGGVLYHALRAPTPEQVAGLPDNVTLFSSKLENQ